MKKNEKQNEGLLSSLIGERTSAKTAGLTYTVAALAMLAVSFFFLLLPTTEGQTPQWKLYLNFLAAPLAFLFVGIWYFAYTKTSFKEFVKEQKCRPKYYLIAVIMQVGLFSLSELNGLFLKFLESFGYKNLGIELPSMDGFGFVGVLFTVAVLPALMEEFVFRGIFLRETKNFSVAARVILCGSMFALYHQNPAQTIYQFICGAAFALIAVRSGSFLPAVLAHFINNAFILTLEKLKISAFTPPVYAIILIVSGICLVGASLWLTVFDKNKETAEKKKEAAGQFFLCGGAGILLLLLSWLAGLFAGV